METTAPFYFLDEFIEKLLVSEGITLTEDQKKFYIPTFSGMAEKRMGGELMVKLNETQLEEFEKLFSDPNTTTEVWNAFWHRSVPNFSEVVEESLKSFAGRVKELLAKTA